MENVYAGGDIAYAPIYGSDDTFAAIGHYSLAHYHGKTAALNICGKETSLNSVPFFWTNLLGKNYRYAGKCAHNLFFCTQYFESTINEFHKAIQLNNLNRFIFRLWKTY